MKWNPSNVRVPMHALAGAVALALALPGAAIAAGSPAAARATAPDAAPATANPASPSGANMKAPHANGAGASHVDRVEARIKDLRSKLMITPAEESQWDAVVQVMRENARTMDSLVQTRRERAAGMTALDDVKSYSEIADAHAEGLKKFLAAFEPLYTAMSDSQKKTADQLFHANTRLASRPAGKGS